MKVLSDLGGGLHYLDGPQGHGKSYHGQHRMIQALRQGRYVVTNQPFLPGWSRVCAAHDHYNRARYGRAEVQRWYESRYLYTDRIGDLFRFDLPCQKCGAPRREPGGPSVCANGHALREGRGLAVWDEAHNDLGNRSWQEQGREVLLKGATQLRKLGWSALLVTQSKENTDAGLRRVCGWRVRMTNLQKTTRLPIIKVSPFPRPFFIAAYYVANVPAESQGSQEPEFYDRFLLRWPKRTYDTLGIFAGLFTDLAELGDRIVLPAPGATFPRRRRGEVVPAVAGSGRWWRELVGENSDEEIAALEKALAAIDGTSAS